MAKKSSPSILKRTKIVCTIGPASSSPDVLKNMISAGMNIARINFSHGTHENNAKLVQAVRDAAKAAGLPVAILLDLQGPKIRIGEVDPDGITLTEGDTVILEAGVTQTEPGQIPVPYTKLAEAVQKGTAILLDDGTKELEVMSVKGNIIKARILLGGVLLSRKGITVPGVSLVNDAISKKDEEDLAFALKHNIDFVAMSFVREARDIQKLKQKIQKYLPKGTSLPAIIAKIEKSEALENFEAILEEVDGIMIARGDLGLETPISQVPVHQKAIIRKCIAAHKPMITATEMLGSMQFNPRPTRAEVSDVANAVFDQSDAVMLSGESAMGKYPVRVVEMMSQIIHDSESALLNETYIPKVSHDDSHSSVVAESAITLAKNLQAKALVIFTQTGNFAHVVSSLRPNLPVIVFTDQERVYHQVLLNWGVTPILTTVLEELNDSPRKTLSKQLPDQHQFKKGDQLIILSDLEPRADAIDIIEL